MNLSWIFVPTLIYAIFNLQKHIFFVKSIFNHSLRFGYTCIIVAYWLILLLCHSETIDNQITAMPIHRVPVKKEKAIAGIEPGTSRSSGCHPSHYITITTTAKAKASSGFDNRLPYLHFIILRIPDCLGIEPQTLQQSKPLLWRPW